MPLPRLRTDMRRRDFIVALGGTAAIPLAARSQERVRRMGVLMPYAESDPDGRAFIAAFREGLQKLGWTEDRNIRIDYRWAPPGDAKLRQGYAKELVALQPNLILTQSTPTTTVLMQQTRTIPIVFAQAIDPVGSGFVRSFAQPGGNVTGIISMEPTMANKWIELLKEIAPRVDRIAMLFNPMTATYNEYFLNPFEAAAAHFGVQTLASPVRDMSEFASFIAAHAREPGGGFVVMPDTFMNSNRMEITSLAARFGLPAVYPYRFFAEAGGLLSYAND